MKINLQEFGSGNSGSNLMHKEDIHGRNQPQTKIPQQFPGEGSLNLHLTGMLACS